MSTADETHVIDDLIRSLRPAPRHDPAEEAAVDAALCRLRAAISAPPPRARRDRRRRVCRPVRGTVPIAISCGVALLVVAVALIALGGRGRSHPQATLRGPVAGAGANALIAKLAVLRRRQAAADQLPANLHIPNLYATKPPTIIPNLSRLVATPPGAKIYLVVTEPTRGSGALWSPSLGDQLNIVAVTKSGAVTEGAGYPAADIPDPTNIYAAGVKPSNSRQGRQAQRTADAYDVAIVPDGVARVRWTFATRAGGSGPVVTVPVTNNVAITTLTTAHSAVALHTTWYAADGHVVPTSSAVRRRTLAAQNASRRRAALATARRSHVTATPAILHAFAVFDFDRRLGTHALNGYVISHPALSRLPLTFLSGGLGQARYQQDLRDVRKIVAPSGQTLYVIPGVNTICLFAVDVLHLPYGRVSSGMSGSCAPSLASALKGGVGETASGGATRGSMVYAVVPRTTHNYKLQTGPHAFRIIHPVDGVVVAHTPLRIG